MCQSQTFLCVVHESVNSRTHRCGFITKLPVHQLLVLKSHEDALDKAAHTSSETCHTTLTTVDSGDSSVMRAGNADDIGRFRSRGLLRSWRAEFKNSLYLVSRRLLQSITTHAKVRIAMHAGQCSSSVISKKNFLTDGIIHCMCGGIFNLCKLFTNIAAVELREVS